MYYLFDNMKVLAESVEKKDGFVPANRNNPDGSRELDHGHISQSNDKTLGRIFRRTFAGRPVAKMDQRRTGVYSQHASDMRNVGIDVELNIITAYA